MRSKPSFVLTLILSCIAPSLAYADLSFMRAELIVQAGKILPSRATSSPFTPDEGHDFTFQAELVFFNRFAVGGEYRTNRFENWSLVTQGFKRKFPYHASLHNWEWKSKLYGGYLKYMPFRGKMYEIYLKGGILFGSYENRGEYYTDPSQEKNPPEFMEYITGRTNNQWGLGFGIGATANITRLLGLICEVQWFRMRLKNEAIYPVLHGTDIPIHLPTTPFPVYADEWPLDANLFKSNLDWVDIRFGLVFFIGR